MKTVLWVLSIPLIGYVLAWVLCFVCLAGAYLSTKHRQYHDSTTRNRSQDNPNKQTNH